MKISAKGKTFIACIVGLFLLIGVPLIINACYSAETVIFQTQWDAADVLSYYGTIMGAAVTVGALAVTIRFTKKQIDRESYAKSRKEKWFKIEQIINNALEKNSPNLLHEIGLLHYSDGLYFQEIQKYVVNACAAINRVSCDINADDVERLGSLAIKIVELHNKVVDHCIHYGYKGNLLATDGNNDGTPPSETYVSSQKILIDL